MCGEWRHLMPEQKLFRTCAFSRFSHGIRFWDFALACLRKAFNSRSEKKNRGMEGKDSLLTSWPDLNFLTSELFFKSVASDSGGIQSPRTQRTRNIPLGFFHFSLFLFCTHSERARRHLLSKLEAIENQTESCPFFVNITKENKHRIAGFFLESEAAKNTVT